MAPINLITASFTNSEQDCINSQKSEDSSISPRPRRSSKSSIDSTSGKRPSISISNDTLDCEEQRAGDQKRKRSTSVRREPTEMKFKDFCIRKKFVKPPKATAPPKQITLKAIVAT